MEMSFKPVEVYTPAEFDEMMNNHYHMFKLNFDESLRGWTTLDINMPVFKRAFLQQLTRIVDFIVDDEVVGYAMYTYHRHTFHNTIIMGVDAVYVKPEYRDSKTMFRLVSLLKKVIDIDNVSVDIITFAVANTMRNGDSRYKYDKLYVFNVR